MAFAPSFHFFAQYHAEVRCQPGSFIQLFVVERNGCYLYGICLLFCNIVVADHLVEHHITAFPGALGIDSWVVCIACFKHTNQYRSFAYRKSVWFFFKECFGGIANAIYIITEWNGI